MRSPVGAGQKRESLLIQVVAGTKEDIARMPKKRDPLSDEQIGILRAWIDQGADWPETAVTKRKDWKKHWPSPRRLGRVFRR